MKEGKYRTVPILHLRKANYQVMWVPKDLRDKAGRIVVAICSKEGDARLIAKLLNAPQKR